MATTKERHPYAYQAGNEEPRSRRRTVLMEVFSCGFSRTGTMSMRAALEILGYPTWHFVDMAANCPDMDMWSEAMIAKFDPDKAASLGIKPFGRKEFDNMLGYWSATTDQPAAIFCEELLEAYPEAKVVLVERDIERWYKSFDNAVIQGTNNSFIPFATYIDSHYMARVAYLTDLLLKYYFNITEPRQKGIFNNPKAFQMYRENARDMYRKHNEMVKRVTPKEKLLLFKLDDGWEPLCKFLGKPIPSVPFPRLNETAAAQEMIEAYIANSYKRALWNLARRAVPVLLIVGVLGAWWMKR